MFKALIGGLLTMAAFAALAPGVAAARPAAPQCSGENLLQSERLVDRAALERVRAVARATPNGQAILWRIEAPGVAPSHLFGTIHITDDRVAAISPKVRAALTSSRRVALEIEDLSDEAIAKAMAGLAHLLVFNDGRKLSDLLTPTEMAQARLVLKNSGIPPEAAERFRPWLVGVSMAVSVCERKRQAAGLKPLDDQLGQLARASGIKVVGLETVEDQFQAMAGVAEAAQVAMTRVGLKTYALLDDITETMVQSYLSRDLSTIWPLNVEMGRKYGYGPEAFLPVREKLITVRNVRMRDAAIPLIKEGNAFIAVGALHLPDKDGLVQLLIDAGYKVTPVE